ncbi:hypothetical protein ISS86_02450 [Candidatus Microgenomates bacterium]|nr:hypothetical protein [Candidatus Microgenomates bacterium]
MEINIPVVTIESSRGLIAIEGFEQEVLDRMARGSIGTEVVDELGDLALAAYHGDWNSAQKASQDISSHLCLTGDAYEAEERDVMGRDRHEIIRARIQLLEECDRRVVELAEQRHRRAMGEE